MRSVNLKRQRKRLASSSGAELGFVALCGCVYAGRYDDYGDSKAKPALTIGERIEDCSGGHRRE